MRTIKEITSRLERGFEGPTRVLAYRDLFDRLNEAVVEDLAEAGLDRESLRKDHRPWPADSFVSNASFSDIVLLNDEGAPLLLVEVSALLSSPARNMRNRLNEAVASATSIRWSFDGPGRAPFKPCVALVFILDGTAVDVPQTPKSYDSFTARRREVALELARSTFSRLLADGLVDAVCFLLADRERMEVTEPYEAFSFEQFVGSIEDAFQGAQDRRVDPQFGAYGLGRAFALGDVEGVVSGLTSTPSGLSAVEGAVVRDRRSVVARLQTLALADEVNETAMHKAIGKRYWLFGGQYVGVADRRSLMPLDQYDIPLLCADGSLEVIELKGPEVDIVRWHRNHLIVTDEVHEAVSQCLNYLRSLDEVGPALTMQYRSELGIDFDLRRAKGTVIVGHPDRASRSGASKVQLEQTIRSYNAHLSRLQVLTYADLLDSAERTLRFASE
ncbi:Shedu anti-phage system protein SduA domain-containing protein [Kribbella deserti]|uniref:Shedu anti-phage system protein SduA domain-containing protein n=1 Tax=Kribbella deserti TaxID=1926257 RepID=A0ABV6QIS5_9ACTN